MIVQLLRQVARLEQIIGDQQFIGLQGRFKPPGSVQARPQPEANIHSIDPAQIHPGRLRQREQSLPLREAHLAQPLPHHHAVFTGQRHHVRHGAQRHQVQPLFRQHAFHRAVLQQSLGDLVRQPNAGQVLFRVRVVVALLANHRQRIRQLILRHVVVADDQIQAQRAGVFGLARRADAAVHRQHHAETALRQHIQGFIVQAVAFIEAVGDVRLGVAAQGTQHLHHQGGRGHPVHVVIAVDRHGLAAVDGAPEPLHRPVHIHQQKGIGQRSRAVQILHRLRGGTHVAIEENLP